MLSIGLFFINGLEEVGKVKNGCGVKMKGRKPFFQALILPSEEGWQLRTILKRHYNFSTGLIRQIKHYGLILVNGEEKLLVYKAKAWDRVEVVLSFASKVEPEDLPLDVVYEDSDIIIVNKSAGQVVHPRHQYISGTLANALAGYLVAQGEQPSSFLINRLDKGTSGLLLAAKNPLAALILSKEINSMQKDYLALVSGRVEKDSGVIDLPIEDPKDGVKRTISQDGKDAITRYKVIERFNDCTLLRLSLGSGRTHQIRVHLSAINHPILGDDLYGDSPIDIDRPILHACSLRLFHPRTGVICEAEASLPDDFSLLLQQYSGSRP